MRAPDDEPFGLGGVLDAFAAAGSRLGLVGFTHGEPSTLHGVEGDLATVRARELEAASARLGVERVELLDYPDGALTAQPLGELASHVERAAEALNHEFRTSFVGRPNRDLDITLTVDRTRQRQAIQCHRSQSQDNPVLHRRLQLLGDTESLRYLDPQVASRPDRVCAEGTGS